MKYEAHMMWQWIGDKKNGFYANEDTKTFHTKKEAEEYINSNKERYDKCEIWEI